MWYLLVNVLLVKFVYSEIIVELRTGKIKGINNVDWKGNTFYSFLSIPYAKPPIGPLRFKEPQNADKWEGVRDSSEKIIKCFQREYLQLLGQEDCLYLNVYTPQVLLDEHNLLPVMVFIHGGGYIQGSGMHDFYGAHYLMPEKIVLVTFNYRLGLFGFLNSNNSKLSSNNGMKDQLLALKWVQENIKQFGGNPSLVTIFGESAGASSVHLHVLSPMSKGLFHRAIMQSGCALNAWAYKTHDNVRAVGKFLEISSDDEEEIIQNLQQLPTEKIFQAQEHLINVLKNLVSEEMATSPVVEQGNTYEKFLQDDPKALIQNGNYNDVPLMIGSNNKEGLLYGFLANSAGMNFTPVDTSALIPHTLNICINSNRETARKEINEFYYKQKEPELSDENLIPGFIDLFTDSFFTHGIQNSIQLHLDHSKSPIYFYKFSMDSTLNLFKNTFPSIARYEGAAHLDDLPYLFKVQNVPYPKKGSVEYNNIKVMVKLWTNFAKYGNPTPQSDSVINDFWKPITKHEMNYFEIGNNVSSGINPDFERYRFWEYIYRNYSCDKSIYNHDDL